MAQPLVGDWALPVIASYLSEINSANNPYQERTDHLWSNILTHYFPLRDGFGTEREPHQAGRKFAVNVAVSNIRQNHMHKVIIVEAKPFPHNDWRVMRLLCHLSFSMMLDDYYRHADDETDTMATAISKSIDRGDVGFSDFWWRTSEGERNMMPMSRLAKPPT